MGGGAQRELQISYLSGHDFSVGSRNVDTRVEAGPVVSLDDVTAVDLVGADAAVVGTLGAGEAVLRPAERVLVLVKQGVLLLDAKPGGKILGSN